MHVVYPFHVKHGDVWYAPGTEIEVSEKDVEIHIAQGAVVADSTPVTEKPVKKTVKRTKTVG